MPDRPAPSIRESGSAALVGAIPNGLAKIDLILVGHRSGGAPDASPDQRTGDCANAAECQAGEGASPGADDGATGRAVYFLGSPPGEGDGHNSESQDKTMFFHLLVPLRC